MKKKLIVALGIVLVVALAITGVIAYLTDDAEVNNVFTLSDNVDITLDEAPVEKEGDVYVADTTIDRVPENTYNEVYPGAVMPKDPIVHLQPGAADAYVRALVTVTNGTEWLPVVDVDLEAAFVELTGNTIGDGWVISEVATADNGKDIIYTLTYEPRMNGSETAVVDTTAVFEQIVFPADFTYSQIKDLFDVNADGDVNFEVNVVAQAIQAEGFTGANAAFQAYENTLDDWSGAVDTDWYTANPTASTFVINTAEELAGLAEIVNTGVDTFRGNTITLNKNLDLNGLDWTPIGTSSSNNNLKFGGVFDGNGHIIYNLKADATEGAGLFGFVFGDGYGTDGTIKNLTVEGATINAKSRAGVIAGHAYGDIINCTVVDATVNCIDEAGEDGDKVGAIVGYVATDGRKFKITNNTVRRATVTANRDAGIIAGYAKPGTCTLSDNTWEGVTVQHSGFGTGANIANAEVGRTA